MTRTALITLGLSVFTFGCADLKDELSATEQLLLSAVSGAEDSMSGETGARMEDDGSGAGGPQGGDRAAAPPMFRMCDAEGTFQGYVEAYDTDESGLVDGEETEDVMREHAGRAEGPREGDPREHFLHLLRVVYDVDQSREFEEGEMAQIFDDFTVRCEVIQEQLLAEYDADGDGALSEAEQDAARVGQEEKLRAEREEVEACRDEMGPPPEARGEGGPGEGGEGGEGRGEGGPGAGGAPPFGPLEMEFDADEDGALSEGELATLRDTLRDRIRSGAAPHPECAAE